MAAVLSGGVSRSGAQAVAGDLIVDYLDRLAEGLPDPRTAAPALAEIEDGLRSAAEAHLALGADAQLAAALAVAEFGDPMDLAREFAPVLAAAEAHRDGKALLVSGPIVGAPWLGSALLALPAAPAATLTAAAGVVLALAFVIPCAIWAVAATGRLSRWLPVPARAAVRAVTAAATGAITLDLMLVLVATPLLITVIAAGPATAVPLLAAAASLARLRLTTRTTRALRRTHTLLT